MSTSPQEIDTSQGVVVFSSDYCPFCIAAKDLLTQKSVQWQEYRVDGNAELRQQMSQLAGRTSVPQIWIAGTYVGGCDELRALESQGQLDVLLQRLE